MNPIAQLGRLFSLALGKKNGSETEIERKIREALKERERLHSSGASTPMSPLTPKNQGFAGTPQNQREGFTGLPRASTRTISLNTIALKFPKADAAFRQIRQKFDHYDKDHSQSIDVEELKECLKELQVSLTDTEIQQLFKEADMDSSNGVQFKEFILLLAIVHLLRPSDSEGGVRFGSPEVEVAFDMVENAFLFFDEDKDGYLSRQEIHNALTNGKERSAGAAATQRFAEMDYNTDGLCSFKEFLYAYVGWVGTAEDEEEEEKSSGAVECEGKEGGKKSDDQSKGLEKKNEEGT